MSTRTAMTENGTAPNIEHKMTDSERTATAPYRNGLSKAQLKRATRTRKIFALLASFFLLIATIFLVLVEIGNIKPGSFYSSVYFVRLNVSQIVPQSIPNALLLNTIAQTLGLHDYYQFGLWNFCEGYLAEGITFCSKPKTMYWFNLVSILKNELLAGSTIALPNNVVTYLHILKTASNAMFGLFLTAACLSFILIFLAPLVVYSRWVSFVVSIFVLLAALCTIIASIIGTAISIIFQRAATSFTELNIQADWSKKMFAFMWIASGFSLLALMFHLGMCCCCMSRRKARHRSAKESHNASAVSERPRRRWFRWRM